MKRPLACALALALFLAGCQKNAAAPEPQTADLSAAPPAGRTAPDADGRSTPQAAYKSKSPESLPPQLDAAMLAYVFHYDIEAPPTQVDSLLHGDEQACISAGPTVCQVLSERLDGAGRNEAHGQLELRAEPHWLEDFRTSIAGRVQKAGGKIAGSTIATDDVARSIVDREAALRSKRAERDRLQKVRDTADVDQQLTQVQAEIDSDGSELAAMRARVQMSKLTIAYRSSASLAPDSAFSPLAAAGHGVVRNAVGSLAVILTLLSYLAPFALLCGLGAWLWRRGRRQTPSRTTAAPDGGSVAD